MEFENYIVVHSVEIALIYFQCQFFHKFQASSYYVFSMFYTKYTDANLDLEMSNHKYFTMWHQYQIKNTYKFSTGDLIQNNNTLMLVVDLTLNNKTQI